MTQDDAIAALHAAGLHAYPREWSIGKSIAVANNASRVGEITTYGGLLYIYQAKDASWRILDCSNQTASEEQFESLSAAVARMLTRTGVGTA